MLRTVSVCAALAVGFLSSLAFASDDPIASRQALMKANGAAAGVSAGMMKNEIAFNPAVATLVLRAFKATATDFGDYFPAGTTGPNTKAGPQIWEDMAGFDAAIAKFNADIDAAMAAQPQDLAAFQAAIGPVLGNCRACHEVYQVSN